MKPGKNFKAKDRWGSVEKVVDDAMEGIESEHRELEALYRVCRHWFPDRWQSLEEFTEWNHARLERIKDYDSAIEAYYDKSTAKSDEEYKARKRFDFTGDPADIWDEDPQVNYLRLKKQFFVQNGERVAVVLREGTVKMVPAHWDEKAGRAVPDPNSAPDAEWDPRSNVWRGVNVIGL